jgi:hypothetical protein
MGQLFKLATISAWLLVLAPLAIQSNARSEVNYPPEDEAWNPTHYAALVQRVETGGLALPTLSGAAKPIFERMVNIDNIPMRMGLNPKLAITLRYQKLEPVLQPLHQLVSLYSKEARSGKPYAAELARLMIFESKANGTLLDICEPFLTAIPKDKSYQYVVANIEQIKVSARQIYGGLVQSVTETSLYSKSDMLKVIKAALADLPSYQPVFTDQDREDLMQKLAQQSSITTDQELKTALTELREAIKHRRIPT